MATRISCMIIFATYNPDAICDFAIHNFPSLHELTNLFGNKQANIELGV